jgi:hypothetical protein
MEYGYSLAYSNYYVGYQASETFCAEGYGYGCVYQFGWLNAIYGADQNGDGILGLLPDPSYYGTPPQLMYYLYYYGVIDEPVFAMGLRAYGDYAGSFVDVGFVD